MLIVKTEIVKTSDLKRTIYKFFFLTFYVDNVVQCICMIRVPGIGLLTHKNHPDTTMIQVVL